MQGVTYGKGYPNPKPTEFKPDKVAAYQDSGNKPKPAKAKPKSETKKDDGKKS